LPSCSRRLGRSPTAIRHEEAYLERKFGDRYLEYKRSVRRWI
jgi:protein-S-isoprenylcysteine O-methyltransferase Ste14